MDPTSTHPGVRTLRMRARTVAVALASVAAVLALPAAAQAGSISVSGGVLTYDAAAGEENRLRLSVGNQYECLSRSAPCFIVDEVFGPDISSFPPATCSRASESTVECDVPASVVINLGDRDDSLRDWNGPSVIDGGAGNESLGINGNGGDDVINGGPGDDALFGEDGNDRLDGGDGDDSLEGFGSDGGGNTAGADVYVGGPGKDLVDYSGRTENLILNTDGAANDGAPGEGDNVGADVERLDGGVANDTLIGNGAGNELVGWGGDDTVRGAAGPDLLRGGEGDDRLIGDDGADQLEGDDGDDELDGGPGMDTFSGDTLMIWTGSDRILARDGVDEQVTCGTGDDTAVLDPGDEATEFGDDRCEDVDRAAFTGHGNRGPDSPDAGQGDGVAPRLAHLTTRPLRRGRVAIRYRLSEAATVTFRIQRRVHRRGRVRYRSLRGSFRHVGEAGTNSVRFSGRLRGRRVAAGRYRVVAVARDVAGNRASPMRAPLRIRH